MCWKLIGSNLEGKALTWSAIGWSRMACKACTATKELRSQSTATSKRCVNSKVHWKRLVRLKKRRDLTGCLSKKVLQRSQRLACVATARRVRKSTFPCSAVQFAALSTNQKRKLKLNAAARRTYAKDASRSMCAHTFKGSLKLRKSIAYVAYKSLKKK